MTAKLIAAAKALCARLPTPEHKGYPAYHSRQELDELRAALAEAGDGICRDPGITITRTEAGRIVAVTLTDDENRVQRVLWEQP